MIRRGLKKIVQLTCEVIGKDWISGLKISRRGAVQKYGSQYGGWVVPVGILDHSSVCYCAGVGEDVSFDLALIKKFGCEVLAFDPTPRAIEYVRKNVANNGSSNSLT